MDQFRLDGKVALVSGGSRGLGAAIVQGLAAAGAKVVITDVLVDEGEKLAATIGTNTFFARLDVTREADWEAAIDLRRDTAIVAQATDKAGNVEKLSHEIKAADLVKR